MLTRTLGALSVIALAACAAFTSGPASADDSDAFSHGDGGSRGRPVKVMIISMFGPEGQVWLDKLRPLRGIPVGGLFSEFPAVPCNRQHHCLQTNGIGHTNTAGAII